jgi:putative addiction module component (TIGR02574 family)
MDIDQLRETVYRLSREQKIQLAQDLWDDIAKNLESIPVTAEQSAELDRRRAALEADPSRAITWKDAQWMIRSAG